MMIRVRFHGRGGHGVKTASRILGTAAFRCGLQVQDCPVYGAERRGAAVTAFTRVGDTPIRERGLIAWPDLIVVGDPSLLPDPTAGVLRGAEQASLLLVNAADLPSDLRRLGPRVEARALDIAALAEEICGRARFLSAGLGAAATRLVGGVPVEQLASAVEEELGELAVEPEDVERNVRLAREVFARLEPVTWRLRPPPRDRHGLAAIDYEGPVLGAPTVLLPGNSASRETGGWRLERPEVDRSLCTRCGLCFVRCPEGAIRRDDDGFPEIDYEHCKGCMICRQQCPLRAVTGVREVRSW